MARSGADQVLYELIERGASVVGSSAGAMVLGPDLSVAEWFTPQMNTLGMTDLSALNVVPITLYPHYGKRIENEATIRAYEQSNGRQLARLTDSEAILWREGAPQLVSPDGLFPFPHAS